MNREDVVWFANVQGRNIGPLSWREIEKVIDSGTPADELMVALVEEDAEDAEWLSAAEVLHRHPQVADPPPITIPPEHGLGAWLKQSVEIVIDDFWAFVGATFVALCMTVVTFGVLGPAMYAGLCSMALEKFRGQPVKAGSVFRGMRYLIPALVAAVVLVAAVAVGAFVGLEILVIDTLGSEEFPDTGSPLVYVIVRLLFGTWFTIVATVGFYTFPLIVGEGMGGLEALRRSWTIARRRFLSHFGVQLTLGIAASAGLLLWGIGLLMSAPLLPVGQVAAYMSRFHNRSDCTGSETP